MSHPHILIISAGISGLTLAQGLRRRHVDFTVFERDILLDSCLQGYCIKIFAEMKEKLKELLLDKAWLEFKNTCAQMILGETNLNATDAAVVACQKGQLPEEAALPYTADHGLLCRAMMTGIQDSIYFSKQFTHYEITDGYVKVFFMDGSIQQGTLLVSADGSRSAVHKQFLPAFHYLDTDSCCKYSKSFLDSELKAHFPPKHCKWITVVKDKPPIIQLIISGVCSSITMVTEPVEFSN